MNIYKHVDKVCECLNCKADFIPEKPWYKFCSALCSKQHQNLRSVQRPFNLEYWAKNWWRIFDMSVAPPLNYQTDPDDLFYEFDRLVERDC